jgi:hypothetical protein
MAGVSLMRTAQECTAKAVEMDAKGIEAPVGPIRDGYLGMAAHWRKLAVTAAGQDALAAR